MNDQREAIVIALRNLAKWIYHDLSRDGEGYTGDWEREIQALATAITGKEA